MLSHRVGGGEDELEDTREDTELHPAPVQGRGSEAAVRDPGPASCVCGLTLGLKLITGGNNIRPVNVHAHPALMEERAEQEEARHVF